MGGRRLRQVLEGEGGRAVNQRSAAVLEREFGVLADQLDRAIDYAWLRAIGAFSDARLLELRTYVGQLRRASERGGKLKASFAKSRALEIAGPDTFKTEGS